MRDALEFLTATSIACKEVISCDDPDEERPELPDMSEVSQDIISQTTAAICITTFSQILSLRVQLVTNSDFVARSTSQRLVRTIWCFLAESASFPPKQSSAVMV